MTMQRWSMTTMLSAAVGLAAGCSCEEYEHATCHELAPGPIVGFDVTVGTGRDGSDADIYFCVERRSNPTPVCSELESWGDDFMEGEVETYSVTMWIESGDLAAWWIENRGGAFGLVSHNNDWDLDSIRVDVVVDVDGTDEAFQLYEEREICADTLEAGDRWEPMQCQ